MAQMPVQNVGQAGAAPVFTACNAGGDTIPFDDRTLLYFKNTNAAARNVTITPQRKVAGATVAPVVITVPLTTGERVAAGYDPSIFCDAQGRLVLTYDAAANLSVAVLRYP